MKEHNLLQFYTAVVTLAVTAWSASAAIETTGAPGSPNSTTSIPGNQLPAPAPKFGGVIKETVDGSKAWWPPRVVPPKGAPISIALGAMPPYLARAFKVTADIDIPEDGAEGMLITEGGRFNGWGLYLLKGKPVFAYNLLDLERFRWEGEQAIPPGRHNLVFDGPRLPKGDTGVLTVDGREVAKQSIPHTVPGVETMDEWRDVGYDTRTGVDDRD